jgi:hypothetical protein
MGDFLLFRNANNATKMARKIFAQVPAFRTFGSIHRVELLGYLVLLV